MRGIGNHTPPAIMQEMPADNTSRFVDAQVTAHIKTGAIVHSESAREIAAWWQSSTRHGQAFMAFAGKGVITADLWPALTYELSKPEAEQFGSDQALNALRAYVVAASS